MPSSSFERVFEKRVQFYKDVFGIELVRPSPMPVFINPGECLLPVSRLTLPMLLHATEKVFSDKRILNYLGVGGEICSVRDASRDYTVFCLHTEEVEPLYRGRSFDELIASGISQLRGMTIEERLLFGLIRRYAGLSTDETTKTFCIGSRTYNGFGNIPLVFMRGNELVIDIAHPSYKDRDAGARFVL